MRDDFAPRDEQRSLLVFQLGSRLWAEVSRWPNKETPEHLTQESLFEYVLPYANALSWLRHLCDKAGEEARVRVVSRAFAKEGDQDPESAAIDEVQNALAEGLLELSLALHLEGLSAKELLFPKETLGMWSLDEHAAKFLESKGLKEGAKWVRAEGRKRFANFRAVQTLETPRSQVLAARSLWWLWENESLSLEQQPPVGLAHLTARALVKANKQRADVVGWKQANRLVRLHQSRHLAQLSLAYCAREFVLCGLPYKPTKANEFVRQNGDLRLRVFGDPKWGVPFGQDRLIPIWLASAFQASGKPETNRIYFRSASDLLRAFEIPINGREMQILRERLQRVFSATYQVEIKEKQKDGSVKWVISRYQLIRAVCLWFHKNEVENQYTLQSTWQNYLDLDPFFAHDLRLRSLPIDLDTIVALKRSPAVLDLYAWEAWRSYRLTKSGEKEVRVPVFGDYGLWGQFGSKTQDSKNAKQLLRRWHKKLKTYWPQCPNELTENAEFLILRPALAVPPHAKLSLPGVSRKPPKLAMRKANEFSLLFEEKANELFANELLEGLEEKASEDKTPTEREDAALIHLVRPLGKDPFPEED